MNKTITSYTLTGETGTDARPVKVSASIDAQALPAFTVKGEGIQPNHQKEIAVRVRSAFQASGFEWPRGRVSITIESGGARLMSSALDLPIALAIANVYTGKAIVAGELGLDGTVRPVRGAFQASLLAAAAHVPVLLPEKNARDASDGGAIVHTVARLQDAAAALESTEDTRPARRAKREFVHDFADVRGQSRDVLTAVESAARSFLAKTSTMLVLSGPPGTGKTMIARRIETALPAPSVDEKIQITRVYSALGLSDGMVTERPFRAPHHTISAAALAGGGSTPRPGEVHLATNGVILLDEIHEFSTAALEAFSRAWHAMGEARPMIVASTCPCPCGWAGSTLRECTCSAKTIAAHVARVTKAINTIGAANIVKSDVAPVALNDLRNGDQWPTSDEIAAQIGGVS